MEGNLYLSAQPGKEPTRFSVPCKRTVAWAQQEQPAPLAGRDPTPRSAGQRQKGGPLLFRTGGPLHELRGTLGGLLTISTTIRIPKGDLTKSRSKAGAWKAGSPAGVLVRVLTLAGNSVIPPAGPPARRRRAAPGRSCESCEGRSGSAEGDAAPERSRPSWSAAATGGGAGAAAWGAGGRLPGARPVERSGCWLAAPGGGGGTSRAEVPRPPQPCLGRP